MSIGSQTMPSTCVLPIGRERTDFNQYLVGVVQRLNAVGGLTGLVRNYGDSNLTLSVKQSSDSGKSDAWASCNMRIDGASVSSIVVTPGGFVQFLIETGAEAFLMFVTAETKVFGEVVLTSSSGSMNNYPYNPAKPTLPSTLDVTVSGTQAALTWSDDSIDEEYFSIERSEDGIHYDEVGRAAANSEAYTDTGLTAATLYYYRVAAVNANGYSDYSNVVSKTSAPATPVLVATQFSASRIDLTWNNVAGESDYTLQRSADGSTSWSVVNSPAANAVSYSNTGLAEGTQYFYRIRSNGPDGSSDWSTVVNALTLCATPTGLAIGHTTPGQLDLTWTDVSTHNTGYSIEASGDGVTGWTVVGTSGATSTSFSDTGLVATNVWYYRIRATKTGANSAYSGIVHDTVG